MANLSGLYIKGTGSYEVKEIAFTDPYRSDFSTHSDAWSSSGGLLSITGNQSVGGEDEALMVLCSDVVSTHWMNRAGISEIGDRVRVSFRYYIPSDNVLLAQLQLFSAAGASYNLSSADVTGEWAYASYEFIALSTGIGVVSANAAGSITFDGNDDKFYLKDFNTEVIPSLPSLDKGDTYLECTTPGTAAFPSKQAYGEWEFDWYNTDAGELTVTFFNDKAVKYNGYAFDINTNEQIVLVKWTSGGASFPIITTSGYIDANTWYRCKITRTLDGEFTLYIKGGAFGTDDWVIIDPSGGTGTNPSTQTDHTESEYFIIDADAGDRIANIIMRPAVKQ